MSISIYGMGYDNSSVNSLGNLTASMFNSSSGNNAVGDLALINSGAYKKLLNAYYKDEGSSLAKITEKSSTEKANLTIAKDDADRLKKAADVLSAAEITDDNREELKKNVESFVSAYNSVVKSGSDVDTQSVLRNTLWMTQRTARNYGLLSDVGITIGTDNKLTLDAEKFDKAATADLKTLFNGKDSLVGLTAQKASNISIVAASAASYGTHASAYTFSGAYTTSAVSSKIDTKG
ncbi:MAG: hypothetical protein IKP88_11560 [Lachnospiraceae bacterium]|nr:hypothetical protein [Lachnospiraceae bacterium]